MSHLHLCSRRRTGKSPVFSPPVIVPSRHDRACSRGDAYHCHAPPAKSTILRANGEDFVVPRKGAIFDEQCRAETPAIRKWRRRRINDKGRGKTDEQRWAAMTWVEEYRAKRMTAAQALAAVRSGDRVWIQSGCGTPSTLVKALVAKSEDVLDVEIVHMMTLGSADYTNQIGRAS